MSKCCYSGVFRIVLQALAVVENCGETLRRCQWQSYGIVAGSKNTKNTCQLGRFIDEHTLILDICQPFPAILVPNQP
jgi:hypothetical protein